MTINEKLDLGIDMTLDEVLDGIREESKRELLDSLIDTPIMSIPELLAENWNAEDDYFSWKLGWERIEVEVERTPIEEQVPSNSLYVEHMLWLRVLHSRSMLKTQSRKITQLEARIERLEAMMK